MAFYAVNTDRLAISPTHIDQGISTCDLWFSLGMAFAGDYAGEEGEHTGLFKKLERGDTLFMYHSKSGYVGVGVVLRKWDGKIYKGRRRLMYTKEICEYRVPVRWFGDFRNYPLTEKDGLPRATPGTWRRIDTDKFPAAIDYARDSLIKHEKNGEKPKPSILGSLQDGNKAGRDKLQLVENWDQILSNLSTLESVRASEDPVLRNVYASLIRRGTCFVVYQAKSRVAFAPSKFIGYTNNDIPSHLKLRGRRDGRDTNKAIEKILGRVPEPDVSAEALYLDFCRGLNFEPGMTGTFGVARKFWVTDEVVDGVEEAAVAAIQNDPTLTQTEKEQLVKARLGQGQFRRDLLSLWEGCCLTGCTTPKLLRASHIKPWSKSNNRERLDRYNGLLLTPNADALFDSGYITFSSDGEMIVSRKLPEEEAKMLLSGCARKIKVFSENRSYLEYHRRHRFRASDRGLTKEGDV